MQLLFILLYNNKMSKKKNDNGVVIIDGVTKEIWDRAHELAPDEETALLVILHFVMTRRGLTVDDKIFFTKETKQRYLDGENIEFISLEGCLLQDE